MHSLVLYFKAKSLQSCLILCNPIDGSPPGSPVPGILRARTLEWAAISFSNFSRSVLSNSFMTPWTVAHKAPLSWNSPGKNTGVGCHALIQGIFPTQGSNPCLPHCRWILYRLSHEANGLGERDREEKADATQSDRAIN